MAGNIGLLGFLSPDGNFYGCKYWEHSGKARELCKEVCKKTSDNMEFFGAIEYLLNRNWLIFRSNDVAKFMFNEEKRDSEGSIEFCRANALYLTEEQKKWVDNHAKLLNTPQIESYEEVLDTERAWFNAL